MQSFSPNMGTLSPDFRISIDLGETLGSFTRDLSDPRFEAVHEQFTKETCGYIARGLIHSLLRIAGGLTVADAVKFFPYDTHKLATTFLENFWHNLSTEVSRTEALVRLKNPGRSFDACTVPSPMIDGYSTLTIWYGWHTEASLAIVNDLSWLSEEEPEPLGF